MTRHRTNRLRWLGLALVIPFVLAAACGGEEPKPQPRQSSYDVLPDSRAAAGTLLRSAADAFPSGSGEAYFLTWTHQEEPAAIVRGSYFPHSSSAVQRLQTAGGGFETRIRGGELWGRPFGDGITSTCWYRFDTGAEDPLDAGALPALSLPLAARAIGSLTGGADRRVVSTLPVQTALAAVMPKLANSLTVDPETRFDGVVTVVDGRFRSVMFHVGDLVAALRSALRSAGTALPHELDSLGGASAGEVAVSYSAASESPPVPVCDGALCAVPSDS